MHPMKYSGTYPSNWVGYTFKAALGYTSGKHTGCDYNYLTGSADKGLPIVSIANGVVRMARNLTSIGFGNTVIIEHPLSPELQKELGTPALFSRYMHLENLNSARAGQEVSIGQQIGTCGTTGTKAYHLHLDLWKANLGVHTRYDKDTPLESYLDPFVFISNHLKEGEPMVNRGDVINMWKASGLKSDPPEIYIKAWVGKDWKAFMYDLVSQPEWKSANKVINKDVVLNYVKEKLQ